MYTLNHHYYDHQFYYHLYSDLLVKGDADILGTGGLKVYYQPTIAGGADITGNLNLGNFSIYLPTVCFSITMM